MGLTIDSIGRKRALIIGLGLTALWIYGYSIANSPLELLLFRATHAISGSLVFPASIAMIVDGTRKKVTKKIGTYWMIIGGAMAVGSALSAILVRSIGFRPLFMIVVIISLLGFFLALLIPETGKKVIKPKASLKIIASSIRMLSIAYISIFSIYFIFGAIVGSLSLALILDGIRIEDAASLVGRYMAVATLIALPIFYLVGRGIGKLGIIRTLILGLMFATLSQISIFLSIGIYSIYISSAILGIAIPLVYVSSTSLAVLPEAKGSSIGLQQTANIAGVAVAAPLSGLLLKYFGPSAPFTLTIFVQILSIIIVVFLAKKMKSNEKQILQQTDSQEFKNS
jgi:MFS family permease